MAKPAKTAAKTWVESRPVNLRLDPDDYNWLASVAEAQARPLANLIKFALKEWRDGKGYKAK